MLDMTSDSRFLQDSISRESIDFLAAYKGRKINDLFCFSILSSVLPLNRNNWFISWVIIAEEVAEEAEEKHDF